MVKVNFILLLIETTISNKIFFLKFLINLRRFITQLTNFPGVKIPGISSSNGHPDKNVPWENCDIQKQNI